MNDLTKILFLDIETVPQKAGLDELSEDIAHLWEDKHRNIQKRLDVESTPADTFANSAGIYAEFGKIVCISVGYIYFKGLDLHFRTKSFAGDNEYKLLEEFASLVSKFCSTKEHTLCGHNIREFDLPYICRRMIVNNIPLPEILNISGKKPWEINFLDTLELWKFGDFKNYTSLKLLTAIFGISTPKDDIDGSEVAGVYYKDKDINRIAIYCQKDVVATAQVYLRLTGYKGQIKPENIEHI